MPAQPFGELPAIGGIVECGRHLAVGRIAYVDMLVPEGTPEQTFAH